MPRKFVPDERVMAARAMLPEDRPPTKREFWDYCEFLYGDIKPREELVTFAREGWAWRYYEWIRKGWFKQPDWTPGEPINRRAVPSLHDFEAAGPARFVSVVERFYSAGRRRAA